MKKDCKIPIVRNVRIPTKSYFDTEDKREKKKLQHSVMIATPTFGWVSMNWHQNVAGLQTPIWFSPMHFSPSGMEIGKARNHCVEAAFEFGSSHIMFIDDDVLCPVDALLRLMNHDVPVAAGVYWSKQRPSSPLIFVEGHTGGYTDWELGDLLEVDACGMGCTLLKMEVFEKMDPPWFKTIRGEYDDGVGFMTEDIFFCKKMHKELGLRPLVDTGIQCIHEDYDGRTHYYYDPEVKDVVYKNFMTGEAVRLPRASVDKDRVRKVSEESEKSNE
jgi:hypothetical protein